MTPSPETKTMTEGSMPIEQRAHSLWQRLKSTAEMGDAECEKLIALELTEDGPTPAADEVEAVARAICEASQGQWRTNEGLSAQAIKILDNDALNNHWRHKARAAIAALQARSAEPVEEWGGPLTPSEQAMIDTAWEKHKAAGRDRAILEARRTKADDHTVGVTDMIPAEPAGEEPLVWSVRRKGTHEMVWDDGGFIADSKEEAEHFAGYFVNHEAFPLYARPATPTNPERLVEAVSFDMDAAPKNEKILLWIPEEDRTHLVKAGYWIRGQWDNNRYAKKPKPYWSTDDERIVGTIDRRKNQPTAWMPLPAAPLKEGE